MRTVLFIVLLAAVPALADTDTFFCGSKDGSYFLYQQVSGINDLTEIIF